jgi:SAM-dependent methyltransferase
MTVDEPRETLTNLIAGHVPARAVQAAAELGLADLIANGATSAESLAEAVGADVGVFARFMRYLVSLGLFDQSENGYALTAMGDLLRSDAAGTLRPIARLSMHTYPAWIELLHSVRTGEPGYRQYFGRPLFDHIAEVPDIAAIFDAAMTAVHGPETAAMLDAFDFSDIGRLVDVGGGNGTLLMATLARHPAMRGVLFDLPHVAERAEAEIKAAGFGDRCETVGGSFFEAVPGGADAILLRHIVHDWADADAVRILGTCARALAPDGRVLVVEMLVPEDNEPSIAKRFDMSMLALLGGVERTEAEYRTLFEAAGLTLTGITPTASPSFVIEGRPSVGRK